MAPRPSFCLCQSFVHGSTRLWYYHHPTQTLAWCENDFTEKKKILDKVYTIML